MSEISFSEADVNQSICRESFYEFVKEHWEIVIPDAPVWNWHIKVLCDELQALAERVFLRLPKLHDEAINIPPGTTKSTICSVMFPPWLWTRQPELRTISASYEELLALLFSVKSRNIILSEKYQATFRFKQDPVTKLWRPSTDPDAVPITLNEDQNTKGLYQNMANGDRKAVGAGGQLFGSHGHFIIVDDPINPRAARSEVEMKTINSWFDETLPTRKVDKAVCPTILIMQRLHQNDPTGHLLERGAKTIRHICLPGEISDLVKPARLRQYYVDGLLDPKRLGKEVLKTLAQELGPYGYAGQISQSPIPEGGAMFKVEKIEPDQPPPYVDFVWIYRHWDKAGTKDDGDFSTGTLLGKAKNGKFYILDCIYGQWDSGTREQIILQTAKQDAEACRRAEVHHNFIVISLEQEPGSGGKQSAESTVQLLEGFRVVVDKPTGDKIIRADPFSIQVNMGNVRYAIGAMWWPKMRDELRYFPFGKHDDTVDGCSGAFNAANRMRIKVGAWGTSKSKVKMKS